MAAVAPVLPAPAAGQGDQVIGEPKYDDCAKVREWIVYGCAEQAAYSNEKCDKK